MITQNNIMHMVYSKGAPLAAGTTVTAYTDLTDKQCAILTTNNVSITNLAGLVASDQIRLVYRTEDKLVYSPFITLGNVLEASKQDSAAATEQVDYVGYNGTSGSIDTTIDTDYIIRLYMTPNDTVYGNKLMVKFGAYRSLATTTQTLIARYLHENLVKNFKREPISYIRFERIYSGALLNALGTSTAAVVKGSKNFTTSEDMTALITAGTILRMGGTGAGTTPCYTVTGHDGGATTSRIYYLDVEYQGTTGTVAAADFESCATGGNWGIKMTGIARSDFKEGWFKYQQTTWETQIQGFVTATVTHSATPFKGYGTYQEVAELEWFLQANEGSVERVGIPAPTSRKDADPLYRYGIIRFKYVDNKASNGILGSSNTATMEIIIFVEGYLIGTGADANVDDLRGFLASTTSAACAPLDALGALVGA